MNGDESQAKVMFLGMVMFTDKLLSVHFEHCYTAGHCLPLTFILTLVILLYIGFIIIL